MNSHEVKELLHMMQILMRSNLFQLDSCPNLEEVMEMSRCDLSVEDVLANIKEQGEEFEAQLMNILQWYYKAFKPVTWAKTRWLKEVNSHLSEDDIRIILAIAPIEEKSNPNPQ